MTVDIYPLDWKTQEIELGQGRSVTVRHPKPDEILERDRKLMTIGCSVNIDKIDAMCFDLVKIKANGFDGELFEPQKAKIFNGIYMRRIYVRDDWDQQAPVPVIEEIGSPGFSEPDFTITHLCRRPSEGEIELWRKLPARLSLASAASHNLSLMKPAMRFYAKWLVRIDGASVTGQLYTDDRRSDFINHVDPLIQRRVVDAVFDACPADFL